ncbi:CHAT domain-containing protein, partial [Mycena leptocephala]
SRSRDLENLAIEYFDRYQGSAAMQDIDCAVAHAREAVNLTPANEPTRAGSLRILAAALVCRYERLAISQDIEDATKHSEEALLLTPEGPERCTSLQTIAWVCKNRYEVTRKVQFLDRAIDYYRKALDLVPGGNKDEYLRCIQGLSASLGSRYQETQNIGDLNTALGYDQELVKNIGKGDPDRPTYLRNLASSWHDLYRTREINRMPLCRMVNLAMQLSLTLQHPLKLLDVGHPWHRFNKTLQSVERLMKLPSAFFPRFYGSGILWPPIKSGLATALQQSMRLKTRPRESVSPSDGQELERLSFLIYDGSASLDDRQKDLLARIRKQPGLKHFLQCKPYSQIRDAAKNGPVVILNSHETRCDAIILHKPGEFHCIFNSEKIQTFKHLVGSRAPKSAREGNFDMDLNGLLGWLEQWIVSPVYKKLKENGFTDGSRLWWCPIGRFKGLPLHAASDPTWFIPSYTVTLDALVDTHPSRDFASNWKMGIVGILETGPNGENRLLKVEDEVKGISKLVPDDIKPVLLRNATAEAVKTLLEECSWIHFACHGEQNKPDPQNSCLLLYESTLTLDAILRLQLPHAEFAFLSACETIRGDDKVINEALHLGGGFIAAGFQGAIGTLWNMADEDGPKLAEEVYGHL